MLRDCLGPARFPSMVPMMDRMEAWDLVHNAHIVEVLQLRYGVVGPTTNYFATRKSVRNGSHESARSPGSVHRCGLYQKLHQKPRPKAFATQANSAKRSQNGAAAQAAASGVPPSCSNCGATSTPMVS